MIDNNNQPLQNVKIEGFPNILFTDANGEYTTYVPANWSGTVTPQLTDYTFQPASRAYSNVGEDFAEQNYKGEMETILANEKVNSFISVYPNPASQEFNFHFSNLSFSKGMIVFVNSSGKKLYTLNLSPDVARYSVKIDTISSSLVPGLYYALLYFDNRFEKGVKLMVMK